MNKLNWIVIKSALMSSLLTAILAGAGYVIGLGDVFNIDVHALINVVSLSALTGIVSVIKALLTTEEGKFGGVVKIK